jgi:hypothetical protein
MMKDSQFSWNKGDVALRRAHFLLPELMKLRARRTLSEAVNVISSLGDKKS